MPTSKQFSVYIMTNGPKSPILYTGITGDLPRRVWQHKSKRTSGFPSRYNMTQLVYYERFVYPDAAISREKEIKGWVRSKKIKLIESVNPHWHDLAADWENLYKPVDRTPASAAKKTPPLSSTTPKRAAVRREILCDGNGRCGRSFMSWA